jgi:hypothetical protein
MSLMQTALFSWHKLYVIEVVGSECSCTVFKVTSVLFISDIDGFRQWNWVIF